MSAPKIEHRHMAGRDACPNPDCVKSEDRRFDKTKALALAKKIQERRHDSADVQELARLTLRLLED